VADSTPVAWFVATTLALAIAAPVASVTVPLKVAVDCASPLLPKKAESTTKRKACKEKFRPLVKFIGFIGATAIVELLQKTPHLKLFGACLEPSRNPGARMGPLQLAVKPCYINCL
jgi:hypothetical protein